LSRNIQEIVSVFREVLIYKYIGASKGGTFWHHSFALVVSCKFKRWSIGVFRGLACLSDASDQCCP
jgi:hypothetical protein